MKDNKSASLFQKEQVIESLKQSFVKLNPRMMIKNPIMFTVEVATAVMFFVTLYSIAAARLGDLLALINSLSRRDEQRAVVLIIGHIAVVVVDDDNIAHRALITGEDDASAVGSVDRRAARAGDVDALVVSRRAADAGVAVTKARGDAARARPAEAAGGVPGRTDLRAAGARLGHRVGERDGRDDRALLLLAVDIGDIGHDISLAERALGDHALVALIHGRIAHVVHVIVDVLDIVLPLGDLDGQIRHGVRERQRIADVDAVDVVAGVQRFELGGGHAVVVGDLAPAFRVRG